METRLDPPGIPLLVLAAAAPSRLRHHRCRGLQGRQCWSWGSRDGRQRPRSCCSRSLQPPASCFLPGLRPFVFLTINGTAPSIVSAGAATGCHSSEYFPLAASPVQTARKIGGEPPSPSCILCPTTGAGTLPPALVPACLLATLAASRPALPVAGRAAG